MNQISWWSGEGKWVPETTLKIPTVSGGGQVIGGKGKWRSCLQIRSKQTLTDLNNSQQQTLFLKLKVRGMRDFIKGVHSLGTPSTYTDNGTGVLHSAVKVTFHLGIWERAVLTEIPESVHTAAEASPLSPKLSALVVVNPGTCGPQSLPWSDLAIASLASSSEQRKLHFCSSPTATKLSDTPRFCWLK